MLRHREIGLSGEVRPVSGYEQRLKEAGKLGFIRAYCPSPSASKGKSKAADLSLGITPLAHVRDVWELVRSV